jgi:hypothetical protein
MLVDWLIYGAFVFAIVKLLNGTVFKTAPASTSVSWILTIVVFLVSVVVLSTAKAFRFQTLSQDLGFTLTPRNPLDLAGGVIFAWLFFSFLRRARRGEEAPPSTGGAR